MVKTILHNTLLGTTLCDIVVDDGVIVDIHKTAQRASLQPSGAELYDCTGYAAFPTFANAHTHAAMTLFRGYAGNVPLNVWLNKYIWPAEERLTPEMVYWGTRLACVEMIKSGTTAFANMYFFQDAEADAVRDSGIRALLGYNLPDRGGKGSLAERVEEFVGCHDINSDNMVRFALAPHSVYAVSEADLVMCANIASNRNLRYLIHMSETQNEVDNCLQQHGCRPYEYLDKLGILQQIGPNLIGAHSLYLSDSEIALVGRHHCTVAHNPNSNLKLASGFKFMLRELEQAGANIAIGTDGCSSSDSLDMLEAAKLTALLQRGWRGNAQAMSANQALRHASLGGFKAMGVNAGKIDIGMQADLMLVDLDNVAMIPNHDVESNLLFAAHPDAIDSVMCAGKFVMRHREVPGETLVKSKVRTLAKQLMAAAAVVLLLLTSACRRHNPADGKMIFRYNESAGITSLDPAYAKDQALIWACSQLYNGLVQLDTNLAVQPAIAKSWHISPDGLSYTFLLRNDVCFHKNTLFNTSDSTRPVNAYDFEYSFNRILDPKVASPGLWIFNNIKSFSATSDSTFVVRLHHPFAPQLSLLAMPYCSAVPREVVEHYGADFRKHPCGTGPFAFQYWKEGVKLVLRRNPLYFERDTAGTRLPYLDAVAITFIVDKQTAFLEFVKHNLDFMNSIAPSYKDELLTRTGQLKPKYADKLNMVSTPFLNTEYLGFLMDDPTSPLRDKRVRQAINYAFDRRKMLLYMRNDIGSAGCYGMIPCGIAGYDTNTPQAYDYNPVRARQLLAEAGFPGGKGLPSLTLSTTATYLDLCKYIQQQLGLVGINVQVDVNPPGALRENIAQSKSQWFRGSWIADYPDAENYLSLFTSNNFCPSGPNYTHYSNPRYDELYDRACRYPNDSLRTELYKRMNAMIMDDAPVVVLYYDQILHFTHKNLSGLASNAMNALDLRKVKINQYHRK
ncbi:MAG: amidohydrolase family protein [Bacteroidales bacterium]|nr:amidohydrolase family protein [Bacteroidales bacterium]